LAAAAARFTAAFAEQAGNSRIIPLLLPKSPDCVAAMIGAVGAGKAFACLNRKLRWPQIEGILQGIGPGLALTDGLGAQAIAGAPPSATAIRQMAWRLVEDGLLLGPQKAAVERLKGEIDLRTWESTPQPPLTSVLSPEYKREGEVGCCLFTSGSTGTPKGVLIAQSDLQARAKAEVQWFGLTPDDVLLSVLPFSFDVGLNQLFSALTAGCALVLLDSWLPADILRAAGQFKVTGISGVPAIWTDMLNAKMAFANPGPHASLRYITVSGGDLPREQLDRLPALTPNIGIFKTYGQSEAFRSASLAPAEFADKPTSVGRAFLGTHVYIVREDQTLCAAGEEGEIVHTGLGVMLGYLDGRDAEDKLRPNPFRSANDPAVLAVFTGDLGYLDADGHLYVKGRRDAMMKVAGNRVYPREIVEQLLAGGVVQEAEVVGVKSDDAQTQLFAFVVLARGLTRTAVELRREWANRLPSYMVPRMAVVVEQMPRTANGKPDRPAMMEQARQMLASMDGRG
jgi:acyl-CoA synthetase (AMP-forming)/AMP-acid ligase II